jgi:hypothetical protein
MDHPVRLPTIDSIGQNTFVQLGMQGYLLPPYHEVLVGKMLFTSSRVITSALGPIVLSRLCNFAHYKLLFYWFIDLCQASCRSPLCPFAVRLT